MTEPLREATVRLVAVWVPDWPVLAALRERAGADGGGGADAGGARGGSGPIMGDPVGGAVGTGGFDAGAADTGAVDDTTPVAVIEHGAVVACSAAARAEGVRRGQRRRQAQSRAPGLVLLERDQRAEARQFEAVLTALEAAIPGLHPVRPGLVAVPVRGPARYYGGERAAALAMLGVVRDALGVVQHWPALCAPRAGVADGLFAAEQAARCAGGPGPDGAVSGSAVSDGPAQVLVVPSSSTAEFLAPLAVDRLGDVELAELLPRLGIGTIGGFAALDGAEVAARFGPEGGRLHAIVRGIDPRGAHPRTPPPSIELRVELEPPLDRADQLAFSVRAAADRFVAELRAEQLVATAIQVELLGDDGEAVRRHWLHPRSFGAAEVVDRVRWTLDAGGLRSAVTRVLVEPEVVDPLAAHERGLLAEGPWGTADEDAVHSALSRIQGILGHRGVGTGRVGGGRMPGRRQHTVPWGDRGRSGATEPARVAVSSGTAAPPWPGTLPAPHPATVYRSPRGVAVLDGDERPVAVDERGRLSAEPVVLSAPGGRRRALCAWAGPWPLDERWWSAGAQRSQRFQAVDDTGAAWLLVLDAHGWWAVGSYD